ncbi:response regulator, partial [Vibrio paucivorans]
MNFTDYKDLRVLVIDDSPMYRAATKEMLIKLGFNTRHISSTATSVQAVELCKEHRFDLVLCDYNLGTDFDGFHLLDQFEALSMLPPHCATFVVTGDSSPNVVRGFSEFKIDGYLLKPLNYDMLKQRLPSILDTKKALKPLLTHVEEKQYRPAHDEIDSLQFCEYQVAREAQFQKIKLLILENKFIEARNQVISLDLSDTSADSLPIELAELAMLEQNVELAMFMTQHANIPAQQARKLDL